MTKKPYAAPRIDTERIDTGRIVTEPSTMQRWHHPVRAERLKRYFEQHPETTYIIADYNALEMKIAAQVAEDFKKRFPEIEKHFAMMQETWATWGAVAGTQWVMPPMQQAFNSEAEMRAMRYWRTLADAQLALEDPLAFLRVVQKRRRRARRRLSPRGRFAWRRKLNEAKDPAVAAQSMRDIVEQMYGRLDRVLK